VLLGVQLPQIVTGVAQVVRGASAHVGQVRVRLDDPISRAAAIKR